MGWSCFASVEPPMIILGEGTRQIVPWSRGPRKGTLELAFRTTQQGSWFQWYQERPMAKSPLSQITWAAFPPSFAACTVVQPLPDPGDVKVLTEDDLVAAMTAVIRAAPRSWQEILAELNGQPYPNVYRAFGKLRHQLGRMADERPTYPYTFADGCFVDGDAG